MLKMTIDNEEVLSNNDISIKEEILSPSSTILNNVYPKSWEQDKDYVSRFYYPKDYSKLNIQNFSVEPEEAGTTVEINENATINDVDTTKESRVISLKGQTSQTTTTTGKNLFNKDTITDGYRLDGSGVPSGAASNEFTSDFIEISPSTQYVRSTGGINAYTRTCFYDSSKTFISKDDSNQTFTTPSNAKYLRFSEYTSRLDTMQLEKGATPTTYEPFIPNSPSPSYPQNVNVVSGDNEINICGKNLFDIDNAFHVSISGSGAVGTNEDYRTTDYLPTEPNTNYYFSTTQITGQTSKQIYIAYYDSNKTFISRTSYNLLENAFTTPTNTHFIRAGVYSKGQENVMLEKGSTKTTYEPYIGNSYPIYLGVENLLNVQGELVSSHNGIDYTYNSNGSFTMSGTATSTYSNTFNIINGIINQNKTYTLSVSGTRNFSIGFRLFYSDNTSSDFNIGTSSSYVNIIPTKTPTSFRVYIYGMTTGNSYNATLFLQLEKGTKVNSFSKYGASYIELCKIGTYQDYIYKGVGYNLYDKNASETGTISQTDGQTISPNSTIYHTPYIAVEPNKTYNATCNTSGLAIRYFTYDSNQNYIGTGLMPFPWTIPSGVAYIRMQFNVSYDNDLMLFEGTSALPYEPYNAKDKWLVHKEIGKVVLNGASSEIWSKSGASTSSSFVGALNLPYSGVSNKFGTGSNWLCNKFTYGSLGVDYKFNAYNGDATTGYQFFALTIPTTMASDLSSFKTWLGTNQPTVYYVLANSTAYEITDTTLISQLESLSS